MGSEGKQPRSLSPRARVALRFALLAIVCGGVGLAVAQSVPYLAWQLRDLEAEARAAARSAPGAAKLAWETATQPVRDAWDATALLAMSLSVLDVVVLGAVAVAAVVLVRRWRVQGRLPWRRHPGRQLVAQTWTVRAPARPPAVAGERWLPAGEPSLLAGPERASALDAALDAVMGGGTVLLVADGRALRVVDRVAAARGMRTEARDRLYKRAAPLPPTAIRDWIDARPEGTTPITVVVDGADAVGGWMLGERGESRLVELVEVCRPALRRTGAALVLVEPLGLDRVFDPDPISAGLLRRVGAVRLWDGRRLRLARADQPGLVEGLLRPDLARWSGAGQRIESGLGFALAVVVCGLLATAVAWPALSFQQGAGVALLGNGSGDLVGSLWGDWWVWRAVTTGAWGDILHSDYAFWPLGTPMIPRFGGVLANALSLPFQALGGYPGWWNGFAVAALVANGVAAWLLARHLGAGRFGALVAAVLFGGAPPLLREVADGAQAWFWAAGLPLALRSGLRAVDSRRSADAWWTGIWLGVCGAGNWFYAMFGVGLLVPVLFQRMARADRAGQEALAAQVGRAGRALLPFLALGLPLLLEANRGELLGLSWGQWPAAAAGQVYGDMTLRTLAARSVSVQALLAGATGMGVGRVAQLAVVAMVVAWAALNRGQRWTWPGLLVFSALLATGPYLGLEDEGLSAGLHPLLYTALYMVLPLFSRLHEPDRLLILSGLIAAVMSALLVRQVGLRVRPAARPILAGAAIAGALLFPWAKGMVPMPTFTFEVPAVYSLLSEEGAVMEVPLGFREAALLYQPVHGHPLVNGPGEWMETQVQRDLYWTVTQDGVLRYLWKSGEPLFQAAELSTAHDKGLRYVIMDLRTIKRLGAKGGALSLAMLALSQQIDLAFGPPIYADKGVQLYRVPDAEHWATSTTTMGYVHP